MATAYVSPDGSVIIPESIRVALGLENGGRVEFVPIMEGHVSLVATNLSPSALKGILPRPDVDCSVEEMIELGIKRAMMARKW
ncbi:MULTISPECIES: AbrB/MazE/SpoVT family DNA-binding domain-containing protein [unclassified Duganella]|uniref:AbrB/MazE/SpoVT family DNA-binding domain-containing protein n=1 Tax=unclassified Duganella TaxID=2636909 RepID=UPI0011C1A706|nr:MULTISPECIES: AbrB/MazE/SpoVT family DNA-binding domain-containing protein [unclassified Duganella]